jgi:hypothetical protein
MSYKRPLQPAPKKLFENGAFHYGSFDSPIEDPNLIDADRPYKLPLPHFFKWMQLREWQAFQIMNGTHFIMVAIYNAKKISLAQFIVYDIEKNKKYRYEKKVPAWKLNIPQGLFGTEACYKSKNFSIEVKHDLKSGKLDLTAHIKASKDLPELSASFAAKHDMSRFQPMVVCMPFSEKRAMYSHKCLMPVSGSVNLGSEEVVFQDGQSQLIIDDHKGYYPYPTRYDWVTGMGRDEQGKMIGFNLTDNQILDRKKNNENCLWHDGQLNVLPPIKVERPNGYEGEWLIKDDYGMVHLKFRPVIHTAVDVNLLIMRSKYQGPYGYFDGHLQNSEGVNIPISNMFGMGEDFYLRA